MLLLGLIITDLLVLAAFGIYMYCGYHFRKFVYKEFEFGYKPVLYVRQHKDITYKFGLLPFLYSYDISSFDWQWFSKKNEPKYIFQNILFHVIPFGFVMLIHTLCIWASVGFKFWGIFYQTLLTGQISNNSITYFNYYLGRLSVQPTWLFIIACTSSAVVICWFLYIIRPLLDALLGLLEKKFNFNLNPTSSYLVSTILLLLLWLKSDYYLLLLQTIYRAFLVHGIIDLIVAHFVIVMAVSLVIEILARANKNQKNDIQPID